MTDQPLPHDLVVTTSLASTIAEVSVSDTGPGLDLKVQAQLFQPFITTKDKGMGLGLSICRSIIDAHGGRLWATPNPERGVRFQFTLPLAEQNDADTDLG